MEKQLKDYIDWYNKKRNDFCREVYIDKSTWLKKRLLPYSDWDSEDVLTKEADFTLSALHELQKNKIEKNSASLAILTLSNRVEYASDHSDFYMSYATLVIFSAAVIGASLPLVLRIILSFLTLCCVAFLVHQRLKLRQKVAIYKELVNLFKQFESKHL